MSFLTAILGGDNKETAIASTSASEPTHTIAFSSPSEPGGNAELIYQIDNLQQLCHALSEKLEKSEADALELHGLLVSREERVRRSGELFKEERRKAEVVSKDNRQILKKLAQLQQLTGCLDDDEAVHSMRELYQGVQNWIHRHFGSATSDKHENHPVSVSSASSGNVNSVLMLEIQLEIVNLIFGWILARAMVGLDESFGQFPYHLDRQISQTCEPSLVETLLHDLTKIGPEHVWRHWRIATSAASVSLASHQIEADCDHIVKFVESRFAQHSRTEFRARVRELKVLLAQCIEFKQRLERQGDFYYFFWGPPNRPFSEARMISLTADHPTDAVVESSVWPMLYKVNLKGDDIVVQKELVRTMPRHMNSSSDEDRSQRGSGSGEDSL